MLFLAGWSCGWALQWTGKRPCSKMETLRRAVSHTQGEFSELLGYFSLFLNTLVITRPLDRVSTLARIESSKYTVQFSPINITQFTRSKWLPPQVLISPQWNSAKNLTCKGTPWQGLTLHCFTLYKFPWVSSWTVCIRCNGIDCHLNIWDASTVCNLYERLVVNC